MARHKIRLIDADELLRLAEYDVAVKCQYEEYDGYLIFKRYIETFPSTKAIPIEWIKEWCNMQNGKSLEERLLKRYGVLTLLEDWEKENEDGGLLNG